MIQIKYLIQNSDGGATTKKIQFCNNHEKDLDILYEITKESIEKNKRVNLDQFTIIFGFYVVREIRKNKKLEKMDKNLIERFFKQKYCVFLNEIKKISIEAVVDSIPKKNLKFTNMNIFA